MSMIDFTGEDEVFSVHNPENINGLYFPLASDAGMKSCVAPNLGGDAKLDQESFLLQPVSIDDLHNNRSTRNFWVLIGEENKSAKPLLWSATGASAEAESLRFTDQQDESRLTAGFMWQTTKRISRTLELEASITSFVPLDDRVEIMRVTLKNTSCVPRCIGAVAAIPIYARSADNLRDHRNVTSMLHRISTAQDGVIVKPTMSFDERGHRLNKHAYYVLGMMENSNKPTGFYPTVDAFIGAGTYLNPEALVKGFSGVPAGKAFDGREAMGGLRFKTRQVEPGGTLEYVVLMGIADTEEEVDRVRRRYGDPACADEALERTREHWKDQVNVCFHTNDENRDRFLRWVCFQPFLRRLFGCSFLPHHDYGRGGRGWRDLWQDCLSLLIMNPDNVRQMIVDNFGGVRVDGTNATIIGSAQGEFIADRNGISRVWMDHALWPWMTVKLYLDQTGDQKVLFETAPYFKDAQAMRGTNVDVQWDPASGMNQKDQYGKVYTGTLLEHLLIEHLTGFYEVGEHNIYRLRGADWNDALDMAANRGESVAFSCAYAGNLMELSELIRELAQEEACDILVPEEMLSLIDAGEEVYDSVEAKQRVLEQYLAVVRHTISGKRVSVDAGMLSERLKGMACWLMEHIRVQEWIDDGADGWFNSYYDDHGRRVEGRFESGVRMMLTGQVFAIMSGTATEAQIRRICSSADRYLFEAEIGGYRLNTDFHEVKLDMGRQFGFAYGEKENGSVFSHMATMYANALYRRGFAREGYKALEALYHAATNYERSRIYPGIPEYFNNDGRGLYHYLTGAASWIMLTWVTEIFGVCGSRGDLKISPRLLKTQFDRRGNASISLTFAGRRFQVTINNPEGLDWGEYAVTGASSEKLAVECSNGSAWVRRGDILAADGDVLQIWITLGRP